MHTPTTRDDIIATWIAYHNDGGKLTLKEFAANHGMHI